MAWLATGPARSRCAPSLPLPCSTSGLGGEEEAPPGRWVHLVVEDNGHGMTEQIKAAHLRSFLFHQGTRHRPGPGRGAAHCRGLRRPGLREQSSRPRHLLRRLAAAGRRTGLTIPPNDVGGAELHRNDTPRQSGTGTAAAKQRRKWLGYIGGVLSVQPFALRCNLTGVAPASPRPCTTAAATSPR